MLVITRKEGQTVRIGGNIVIKVLECRPGEIKLGIDAPKTIRIERQDRKKTS
ncbi:carbon storage regulator CsrA [Geothermobacter ehrlichii]|uniref:Carbon storage regulator CsrA n=1 Tax=Geothermobacter ehrlichii TaxID=213224 RepID=A0A5D3WI89_9BACT|nr:carbon storage regulator CsrA [Geothermobacter ehrlichii]